MTTATAAAQYLAEHLVLYRGRQVAVYNPHSLPVENLPVIYGFNNGGPRDWLEAILVAEDGKCLGSHICSHEGYMPADLGIIEGSSPKRHECFRAHYPDGYRMEFVRLDAFATHAGLQEAIAKHVARAEEEP